MIQKIFVAATSLLSYTSLNAQTASTLNLISADSITVAVDEPKKEPTLIISGSVDAYYKYDLKNTSTNGLTSFTQTHNSFSLGMASIKFEHNGNKVNAVADFGIGPRAKDFAYADEGITQVIKQLYVSYSPTDWLKFTLGSWATHVGYELLDPQLNRNYSMSYMFTNGPFSHTGLKAEVSKGKSGFMLGVANATDYRIPPIAQINKKFLLAQYSLAASDNMNIYLNYAGGQFPDSTRSNQFDAVITARLSDKFNVGYNGTLNSTQLWEGSKSIASKSWWGSALYLNYDLKDWFGLTLRSEIFSDKNQLKAFSNSNDGGTVFSTTLAANFKSGGFIFIPEFRFDNTKKAVLFTNKNGEFVNSASNFLIAAVYSF